MAHKAWLASAQACQKGHELIYDNGFNNGEQATRQKLLEEGLALKCVFHKGQVNSFCELCMMEGQKKVSEATHHADVERLRKKMEEIQNNERDSLNKLPIEVAIQYQAGFLLGYANCWNKVIEAIALLDKPLEKASAKVAGEKP